MKTILSLTFFFSIIMLTSCGDKVTKTLYGGWDPVAESDTAGNWGKVENMNFIMSVEGKCEEVKVIITVKGDLTNPDINMDSARCYGNRDQLYFLDKRVGTNIYDLKLDATKDTLTGTVSIDYVLGRQVHQVKFARISGGE